MSDGPETAIATDIARALEGDDLELWLALGSRLVGDLTAHAKLELPALTQFRRHGRVPTNTPHEQSVDSSEAPKT